jgi:dihydrofolate synthase/folylpolyglutamate synthase
MTVGLAFEYFKQQKVDLAIIETGMGGRLDSTNVLQPEVSVITNIGYDHMQFLGESLPEIASEKAAIIKKRIPAIVGERQEEISSVFVDRANEVGTDLYFADQMNLPEIESGLKGEWQKRNSKTALAAMMLLKEKGFLIKQEHLIRGLKNVVTNTGLMGRWQVLQENPLVICDIGHNLDGMKEVLAMIRQTPHRKLHFVLGMVADKNVDPVLQLLPSSATYYFCKADIPRGLDAARLQDQARKTGLTGDVYPGVKDAYDQALRKAAADDLVFVGGSTFVVAEIV